MKDHNSIAQRFAASALSVMLARCIAIVAMFGLNAILARWLTPGDFGLFIFFFSLFALLSLIACLGLNRAVVTRLARKDGVSKIAAQRLLHRSLLITLVVSIVTGTMAGAAGASFVPDDTIHPVLIATLLGATVVLRAMHLVLAEVARGFHERLMSNLFGGCAGGPLPHLVFVGLLIVVHPETLIEALGLYCLAFAVTLPVIWRRSFSLVNA
ncbi:MAG: oligosaccharide flippase family protein, partial [Planctomycetota bacterium]